MTMKPLLILGIGNLVLQDEGFGVHAVRELEKCRLPENVDILDGGTAGMNLMGILQEYKDILIIDAALDHTPIGTVKHIIPKFSDAYPPLITVHEIGLKDVIDAMHLTGYCPNIELITVSVEKYDSLGMELSPKVEAAMPHAVEMVKEIVKNKMEKRPPCNN